MDDATYMARLVEVRKHLKIIITLEHPDAGELTAHTLKLFGSIDRQIRRLTTKIGKVDSKASK